MSNPTKVIVDLSKPKGERETIVELTADEIKERDARAAEAEAEQLAQEQAEAEKQANKDAGIETLKSLGLTDEQISALLG